jgi:hypothetical protein
MSGFHFICYLDQVPDLSAEFRFPSKKPHAAVYAPLPCVVTPAERDHEKMILALRHTRILGPATPLDHAAAMAMMNLRFLLADTTPQGGNIVPVV